MLTPHSANDRERFYAAAVVGLRALDQRERTPRRFGPDADARWTQFRGSLGPADRLDILLRDAAGTWGAAFSPAQAFGLYGLSEDDPFGPDWSGIPDDRSRRILADSAVDLAAAARSLGVQPAAVAVPALTPSTRLIVAGGAAVLAVAEQFARRPDLVWSDQIVAVAQRPVHRQLAALAAVLLGARAKTALVRPGADVLTTLRAVGFAQVDVSVVSADADADAARFARSAAGGR